MLRDTSYGSLSGTVHVLLNGVCMSQACPEKSLRCLPNGNLEDTEASTGNPVWMKPPKRCSDNRNYTLLRKTKVTFCGEGCSSRVKCLANHMQGAGFNA